MYVPLLCMITKGFVLISWHRITNTLNSYANWKLNLLVLKGLLTLWNYSVNCRAAQYVQTKTLILTFWHWLISKGIHPQYNLKVIEVVDKLKEVFELFKSDTLRIEKKTRLRFLIALVLIKDPVTKLPIRIKNQQYGFTLMRKSEYFKIAFCDCQEALPVSRMMQKFYLE